MDIACVYCRALHWAVERVNSKSEQAPTEFQFESCCKKGAVQLTAFQDSPPELEQLLQGDSSREKEFWENIRQYNTALVFTLLGYKKDDRPGLCQKFGLFQLHREVYHMQGLLESDSEDTAQYAQLFFYDPHYAAKLWHRRNPDLNLQVLETLTRMLHWINSYINIYKTTREQLQ